MRVTPSFSLWHFICLELAPYPGRDKAVFRFLVVNALVILLSMTFQVPFMALSLIMTFFTARENTVLTRITGIIMILGGTLGIGASLILLKVSFDYPFIRIVLAALIIFAGMYFFRISKLGVMGFILAILVSYSQSLVDIISSPETLVRMVLWAWVAAIYPVVITLLVNTLMFPASPGLNLKRVSLDILDIVAKQLDMKQAGETSEALIVRDIARLTLSLQQHLMFSLMSGGKFKECESRYIQYTGALERLLSATLSLSKMQASSYLQNERELGHVLFTHSLSLRYAILHDEIFTLTGPLAEHPALQGTNNEILREMAYVFIELSAGSVNSGFLDEQEEKIPLFAPDAWTNPDYARFAVKCVLATLLCYVFYSAVDWPGIHTAMLTCIILALPSVGAITHKGVLRLVGCVLGSAAALLMTIFAVPYLDSIVGLLLVSLPVIAMSAWVASGSERSNYIGVQMAFAFALSMFDQFGPTVSLTEIRDRMVGILLGIVVSTFIYSALWPERDSQRLNAIMGQFSRLLAQMMLLYDPATAPEKRITMLASMRIKGWQQLAQCEALFMRIRLEPMLGHKPYRLTPEMITWFTNASDMFMAINQFQLAMSMPESVAIKSFTQSVAEYFNAVADAQLNPQISYNKRDEAFNNIERSYQRLSTGGLKEYVAAIQNMRQCLHQFHLSENIRIKK